MRETLMRLLWFHLMPYTDLPTNFPRDHNSVWVDIPKDLFDPLKANGMYNDFLDELEFAAEQGFDAICVNEHHSNGYGMMPSPNLMAAALARRTTDTALCVLGNSIALYNPPLRVAEEIAMLDVLSGGRVIAGMPVGSPMDTAYAYSQNPAMLRQRYDEAHDLIVRAWTATEPFNWNGRFHQFRDVNVWQRPIQQPHPPIWIPGGSSVETWAWAAQREYVYCFLSYFGYKYSKATLDGYWRAMDELGMERNPFRAGFLQFVGVAESREAAIELYREPAEYFYGNCLHVPSRYASAPGYQGEESLRQKVTSQVQQAAAQDERKHGAAVAAAQATTMEEIVDRGYIIVGSPDEVAEQLRECATSLNVGNLMLLLQFGNMSKDVTNYNTQMFATQVAPQLRDLFEDQWEHRWWPEPAAFTVPQQAVRP